MKLANLSTAFAYLLATVPIAAAQHDTHRRINVSSGQSIADEIKAAHKSKPKGGNDKKKPKGKGKNEPKGNGDETPKQPKFKLHGKKAGGSSEFEVNVKETTPAITSATTVSVNGGKPKNINEDVIATVLVADNEVEGHTFAIIAVDKQTGNVNGIVQRGKDKTNFTQKKGSEVSV
mmetsp:Transcript_26375/g.43165  ORF Transcript_26375/g.43165 Transcript_26375/m.43165 type:complete len:176 (-) Transcript_26375:373-900(-)